MLNKTLSEQGFETYAGYGWYRIRILTPTSSIPGKLRESAASSAHHRHIPSANWRSTSMGCAAGRTRGMTDAPNDVLSPPVDAGMPANTRQRPVVIADPHGWDRRRLRSIPWAAREDGDLARRTTSRTGFALAIARRWDQHVIASMVCLFLIPVRGRRWAPCFTLPSGTTRSTSGWPCCAFRWHLPSAMLISPTGLSLLPTSVYGVMKLWSGAASSWRSTLEFVMRFTEREDAHLCARFQIARAAAAAGVALCGCSRSSTY